MLHTSIGLINCLEYQIHQKIHSKNRNETRLDSENIKSVSNEKLENENENFANILETQMLKDYYVRKIK